MWVYAIEPGMTWSDGEPVTAADILFTLQYDDANGSANFVSQTDEDGKVAEANVPAVLAFNNANGPFADENLRLAVSYALDYDSFRTVFGSAYASNPNRSFVPPVTVGYKETEALGQDLAKAEQYMADAGYTEKNADGFYVNANGEVCAFTLTCNAGKEAHVGYAELVKTQLEQFGIQVNLETLDGDSYNAKTSNKFSENNITMEAAI